MNAQLSAAEIWLRYRSCYAILYIIIQLARSGKKKRICRWVCLVPRGCNFDFALLSLYKAPLSNWYASVELAKPPTPPFISKLSKCIKTHK